MSKDAYLLAHEELMAEYLEANPGASESVAYAITAPFVTDRMADNYAALADSWRMTNNDGEMHG